MNNTIHVNMNPPAPPKTCCRCGNIATRYHADYNVWNIIANSPEIYYFCELCWHNSPDEHDWTTWINDNNIGDIGA